MFSVKLLKVKKYLNENLSKKFITSSQTFYFFFVLFALKANEDLRFCVNYRKLNVIFKRNKYSLSLIDEIIDKIVSCNVTVVPLTTQGIYRDQTVITITRLEVWR